ncbi:MAG TPA: type II secretion system protein N [Sphingomicrobium sp.]|nr:type II secretion system protein N [Sphingomicrobium sp.]
MNRRLFYWFAGILALGLLAFIPLRMALGRFPERGFTARQVAGTIWDGRIGELNFKSRRLGTFAVALDPLTLLTGATELGFHRLDDPHGVLDGTMVSGAQRGFRETTGRIGIAGLFGALPLDAIEFDDVTVLFKGENCSKAAGQVTVLMASPLPGVDGVALRGSPRCENTRVRFVLSTPSNAGKLEFYVRSSGDYRAWFRVRGAQPDQAADLLAAGFSPSQEGLMMSIDGQL